jgi:hypothetical protein
MTFIVPIVEGHGEVISLPILLRRIARAEGRWVEVNEPLRVSSGGILNSPEIQRKFIGTAANKARPKNGHVLVLLDCDQDMGGKRRACPAELGPRLSRDLSIMRPDVNIYVTLAHKEYESWFLASLTSLRGIGGIPDTAMSLSEPEAVRGAKERLSAVMGRKYKHDDELQTLFTEKMSLDEARRAPSFDRLYRWVLSVAAPG